MFSYLTSFPYRLSESVAALLTTSGIDLNIPIIFFTLILCVGWHYMLNRRNPNEITHSESVRDRTRARWMCHLRLACFVSAKLSFEFYLRISKTK